MKQHAEDERFRSERDPKQGYRQNERHVPDHLIFPSNNYPSREGLIKIAPATAQTTVFSGAKCVWIAFDFIWFSFESCVFNR